MGGLALAAPRARWTRLTEAGNSTRTSAWDSGRPRRPLRGPTSVRGRKRCESEGRPVEHTTDVNIRRRGMELTRGDNRQEVPLHGPRFDPRPYPDGHRRLDQDAPHHCHPPRIPPLHPQVRPVREATQEPCRALLAGIPRGGGRPGYGRAVQTLEQDGTCLAKVTASRGRMTS